MLKTDEIKKIDYKHFYEITSKAMSTDKGAEVLEAFGFSKQTADMFGLGLYDPSDSEASNALRESDPETFEAMSTLEDPHIIVPHGQGYFIAIHSDPSRLARYVYSKGTPAIWNRDGLYTSIGGRPVLILSDLVDALAMAEAGADVVRYRGPPGLRELRTAIETKPPTGPLVMLPSCPRDYETMKEVSDGLSNQGLNIITYQYPEAEDEQEAEKQQPPAKILEEGGLEDLRSLIEDVNSWVEQDDKEEANAYQMLRASASIASYRDRLYIEKPVIPTGYENLDGSLGGGLYQSLIIIGAVSSLGKTTFCLQMADQIAEAGKDVLFFTLEQSQEELMSKSISRISKQSPMLFPQEGWALTPLELLHNPDKVAEYSARVEGAISIYAQGPGEHIFFIENAERPIIRRKGDNLEALKDETGAPVVQIGRVGLDTIRARIAEHIRLTGNRPVVFIDYLQMIQPEDTTGRKSDKQNMDETVSELRRLSKEYDLPIIAISSFNRESYNTAVSMASFKESGAIEYSSDILIGLQPYSFMDSVTASDIKKSKAYYENYKKADIKPVEVKILKNRLGPRGSVFMNFDDKYGLFNPVQESDILIQHSDLLKGVLEDGSSSGKGKGKGKGAEH